MPVAMEFTGRIETIRQSATLMRQLLQDQQVVVCFGQRSLLAFFLAGHLERDQVAGAFTTADEALACLTAMPVTMLICSDQLEQGCGLELVLTAKKRYPTLRTLLLLTRPQRAARLRAVIECGCDGLLLDATIGMGAAISTVQTVAQGGTVVDREIVNLLRDASRRSQVHDHLQTLSSREREVLTLLARGEDNSAIARHLVISVETVRSHVKHLLLKLGARGRTHAAVLALEGGLVDWPAAPGCR
jgi:DNA-binding NarL/FixJ family response regulator